jgi:DNA-binding transcriptional regulator YdaS (Cro superfamily)
MTALHRAIAIAGSQTGLARRIGKTQCHVAQWLRRGRVGPTACIAIELAVGGQVTRYELRPDVFGDPPQPGPAGSSAQSPPSRTPPAETETP